MSIKEDKILVIDTQVVGHYKPLNELHKDKVRKYRKDEIRDALVTKFYKQDIYVLKENINFSSCTLSYRGIWSQSSEEDLLGILDKGFTLQAYYYGNPRLRHQLEQMEQDDG